MSPTYSQMINTISQDFEINKDLLRQDFYSEANKEKVDQFFNKVSKVLRTIYQEEYYTYLRKHKKHVKYQLYFELYKQEEYPYYLGKSINNISTKTKQWKTSDNTVIESIHPLEAKIDKNVNGTIIRDSPFKTKIKNKGTTSAIDVKKIMEQISTLSCFLRLQVIH